MSNYVLVHHGIKGQKWGERNYQYEDGSLTPEGKSRYNKNYSDSQRLQDNQHYGKGGVNRINKHMNEGYNLKTARSMEAERINAARKRAGVTRSVGRTAGQIAGIVAGYKAARAIINKRGLGDNLIANFAITSIAVNGGKAVGSVLGEYGGEAIGMLSAGYSPDKYRYA
jgi:hypothetical protein